MKNPYLSERHLLANEVDVDLDMLRTSMLYRIAGHVYSADIVTEDNSRGAKRLMKLIKKLSKPTALSHGVSHSTIFRLSLERETVAWRLEDQDARLSPR
jgi:hypothetical protein